MNRYQMATRVPTSVKNNTVFIVDTTKLADKEDIKCDDLGAWICTGSKKFIYIVDETGGFQKEHEEVQDKFYDESVRAYSVQCLFYSNKSMPSLRKTVITACDVISTVPRDLAFIQYVLQTIRSYNDLLLQVLVKAKEKQQGTYRRYLDSRTSFVS